jgi:NAD(P)-dependent dehydrogenase (short-subunit alcohol dehydrogenase family)
MLYSAVLNPPGGGSGYGAAISKRFAAEGAKVIIADVNEEAGERVARSLRGNVLFQKTDVAQEADWPTLMERAMKEFGRVDCLVNHAGTTYKNKVLRLIPLILTPHCRHS